MLFLKIIVLSSDCFKVGSYTTSVRGKKAASEFIPDSFLILRIRRNDKKWKKVDINKGKIKKILASRNLKRKGSFFVRCQNKWTFLRVTEARRASL